MTIEALNPCLLYASAEIARYTLPLGLCTIRFCESTM